MIGIDLPLRKVSKPAALLRTISFDAISAVTSEAGYSSNPGATIHFQEITRR